MSANMVSWRDYEGVEGFGASDQADVDNLNKALRAGQDINAPGSFTAGDGFALRVESLEKTLKNLTYRMEHIVLWKNITKLAAYNTIEEHNEISSYSDNPDGNWIDEGDLPNEQSATLARRYAVIKYIGATRRVSYQMTLIKPAHGNVIAQETVNGTMDILRAAERAMFYGNSALSALQFDGFEKMLTDRAPVANIIDLRGKPLSEDILTDAALTIQDAPNYGTPTDLFVNPKVKSDLCKAFFPKERYDLFSKPDNGMIGLDIKGFTSPAGDVRFQSDVFITDGGAPNALATGDAAKRPGTPTVSTGPTTPSDALSKFIAEDAGDYFYRIVACNRYGRSAPVHLVAGPTAVTVAAGDKTTFAMTPGGATAVEWYEIYRSKVGGAALSDRLILRVPNAAGAGAQTIDDYNNNLPYCTSGFLFQQNLESMSVKQLAPLVKIPLATIDTSIRWAQLLFFTPVLYAPGKNVLLRNIGRAVNFVGQP